VLNRSDSGHPYLVPDVSRKTFCFWAFNIMLTMILSNNFYYVEICSFYTHFGKKFFFFFTINGCWILSNVFSAYIKMIMELLFFIDVMYHIDWFTYIKASWWFWVESNLIMVYNLFYVLLDSFASILLRIFASIIKDTGL